MGLGGTAKKLQKVVDAAEKLYSKMNDDIERLTRVEEDVEQTSEQVDRLERDLAEQRALVEALAEKQDVDVAATLEAADLPGDEDDADGEGTTVAVESGE
jgi:peptidoglycan hydrolase CwlO-like protein